MSLSTLRSLGFSISLLVFTVTTVFLSQTLMTENSSESEVHAQKKPRNKQKKKTPPPKDPPEYLKYAIYQKTAPRAESTQAIPTTLPLKLNKGDRIAFIGNTLLERSRHFGFFESLLHLRYPDHQLVIRNLCWPADTPSIQPRPTNFADTEQHLTHEKIDVIFAAFGFNESFAGPKGLSKFKSELQSYIGKLQSLAFNGEHGPKIVLLSPIANENIEGVPAADLNNKNLKLYSEAIQSVAKDLKVAYADLYTLTEIALRSPTTRLTINGSHLNEDGYKIFSETLFREIFSESAPKLNERLQAEVLDKARQYFRRFRPLNTYYYTGSRNRSYGYLDFLPAMRNFDLMVSNRDARIWKLAQGEKVEAKADDSNVPPLPDTRQSRGANRWMSAEDELKSFQIDPRFEVNLFASEEQFPDIAAPIQIRWDSKGRLWVSCSTTYPHVYPGNEPNDKLVILEDKDKDGRADTSTVFADDLHLPLSFEFGDGGVYVSEMPDLTFIKDTDGDGKADYRRIVLTGFGTEDSHHSLHDFTWTPDGDLIWREGIFHHSQVETPYGPVRQRNSGWFRFQPRNQRLIGFGTYHSTNPWGVTFDDWGQHLASHPIYAQAFHSRDPQYPTQHPRPKGLQAYSGVCGQEFVDFKTFPEELQGHFIKVRYKPTNRVEIHKWEETEFGYKEKYVSDLIFSKNLSFIPVDLRYGPRGAMYVCDWYNPIKGHAQYSLRDDRRDRHSGRIWRITAKNKSPQESPKFDQLTELELVQILERPEYRYRYWAKRELRDRPLKKAVQALETWVKTLSAADPRFRHHQIEAVWTYRWLGQKNIPLLKEILSCDVPQARAAATHQLRYWFSETPNAISHLRAAANDANAIVRMEAAIAATYFGTKEALDAILDIARHPRGGHLDYAFRSALGSETLKPHWENVPGYESVPQLLNQANRKSEFAEPTPSAKEAEFDTQKNLKIVKISCVPERMSFTVKQFTALTGQAVKLVFTNPDATDHNLVLVQPDALEEVGMAANDMAKDPKNANSDFIPQQKKNLIIEATPMIGPTRKTKVFVLRFKAPKEPGIYPYVCTFPGHWVMMTGEMIVANKLEDVQSLLAARKRPSFVKNWKVADLKPELSKLKGRNLMRGMKSFMRARCNQCHQVAGHGASFGPDLTKVKEKYSGEALLQQIIDPSSEINEKYRVLQVITRQGKVVSGTIAAETETHLHLIENLLIPKNITKILKSDILRRTSGTQSGMPADLLNALNQDEILDLLNFLEQGGYKAPNNAHHKH